MRSLKHSRGAALLVAMLVAALVAVIATKVGSHYILSFRRSSNMLLGDQGYLFLLSAEALAKSALIADEDKEVDHLGEVWAQQVEPYVIDGGLLTGQVYDLQARFNINNLQQQPQPQPGQQQQQQPRPDYDAFIRLLRTFEDIEISVEQAQEIADATIDWLDENSEPTGFSGAEDSYYAELDIPYRAANRLMLSASELRLVKGMTAELYKALLPHIAALPPGTAININTATVNVLRSIAPDGAGNQFEPLSLSVIESVLEQREEELVLEADGFITKIGAVEKDVPRLESKTNYFLFDGLVKLGDLTVPIRSVLNRDSSTGTGGVNNNRVSVTRRSLGSL